jgi:hypothetical protein
MNESKKMLFINLTDMAFYDGLEENVSGGGRYVDANGFGHELFNFRNDNGLCYGYATPWGRVNLKNISNTIIEDKLGKYLDDVLVVFSCSIENKGRYIAGVYLKSRVYENIVEDKRESRFLNKINDYIGYNIICNIEDAILISKSDRTFAIPHSKSNNGVGHGQHSIWYANESKDEEFKDQVLDYIKGILDNGVFSDETKYHKHDEGTKTIVTTSQLSRSQKARRECIELKGCFCNICKFDFEKTYGLHGHDYIEVHHITPIGALSTAEGYEGTDPEKDLIPLCSNCHSMIHRRKVPYLPEEIKQLLKK